MLFVSRFATTIGNMRPLRLSIALCAFGAVARGHVVLSYPGWRGNNLITNGTFEETNGVGMGFSDDAVLFPYGMQWIYPCKLSPGVHSLQSQSLTRWNRRWSTYRGESHKLASNWRCCRFPTRVVHRT